MSAQPIHHVDHDNPAEIHDALPEAMRGHFLTEYHAALDAAHDPNEWQHLRDVLDRWRLRAIAYADPSYEARMLEARDGRPEDFTPIEAIVPDWPQRLAGGGR